MTVGQKQEPGGTDSKPTGSNQQSTPQSSDAGSQQQSATVGKMDKPDKPESVKVDRWFDRQLNQLYAEVIREPLPKDFLELIEQLRDDDPKK